MSTKLEIPEPADRFDLSMEDGAVIRVRRHGRAGATRLFMSHGNGFAIDGYFPFWSLLMERFDLIVFDMRNHGQNPNAGFNGHNYHQMGKDIARIATLVDERLGVAPKAGLFHSMSARAATKQAVELGWIWDALVLFDPPSLPLKDHPLYDSMKGFEMRLVEFAASRQERFSSSDELADHFREARAHRGWVSGAHDLMARALLRKADNGQWELACRREFEATIYLAALILDLWPDADQFGGPVKLIGADPNLPGPPTGIANKTLAEEGGYDYTAVEGTGHMLQIERPDVCVEVVLEFLTKHGLAS